MDKKNNIGLAIVLGVIFVVIIIIAGYFLFVVNAIPNGSQDQTQNQNTNPPPTTTAGWNTVVNNQLGFSLQYPNNFFDPGHEPKIVTGSCDTANFSSQCPDISALVSQDGNYQSGGASSRTQINGAAWCKYQLSDAAMGHAYNYYYYTTVKNNQCLVVSFATSTENCSFYLPLETGNTQQEQNYNQCLATNANQPGTLSQVVNTFSFSQ